MLGGSEMNDASFDEDNVGWASWPSKTMAIFVILMLVIPTSTKFKEEV